MKYNKIIEDYPGLFVKCPYVKKCLLLSVYKSSFKYLIVEECIIIILLFILYMQEVNV